MTDVLVLGAGGIIGQHLLSEAFDDIDFGFVKKTPHPAYIARDLSVRANVEELLQAEQPRVIINLAGENRVDYVDNGGFDDPVYRVNVGLPLWLAEWCGREGTHLIQVSTQGIFSGDHAPYVPGDVPHPITPYGYQKVLAEKYARRTPHWTIARITFVLGVRPVDIGRKNPLEAMFEQDIQHQVNDRWFSVSFAKDVAAELAELAINPPSGAILHLGVPGPISRYEIASLANPRAKIIAVSDDSFDGPRRPLDTSWAPGSSLYRMTVAEGIADARRDWERHGRRTA